MYTEPGSEVRIEHRFILMKQLLLIPTLLAASALAGQAQVHFVRQPGSIAIEIGGRSFSTLYFGESAAKPYLHPLLSADGLRVTRLYPMEYGEGGSRDHEHHRGLWIASGDVNGIDVWGNEPGQRHGKQGLILLREVRSVEDGPRQGKLRVIFDWLDPAGAIMLTEDRTMIFSGDEKTRTIDFDITFTGAGKTEFRDTKEGFLALRMRDELTELKGTGKLTNAAGQTGMQSVWGKPSPWVDYSGTLEGHKLGVAIFDHPSNLRHPARWHARAYGLFGVNPFGDREYSGDKSLDGGYPLGAGKTLRLRYRVLIHSGDVNEAGVGAAFAAWAKQ